MSNPRPAILARRVPTAIAIAGLSLLLLAVALLAVAWQRRLAASWERPAFAQAAAPDEAPMPRGRALWLIHPDSGPTLLPPDTSQASMSAPWPALPARQGLALLLAGLALDSPEINDVTATWPGQPPCLWLW